MESLPPPNPPLPPTPSSTGEWPAVPPAPAPVKPTATLTGAEPPIINTDVNLIPPSAGTTAADDTPVTAIPAPRPFVRPLPPVASGAEDSQLSVLQRMVRRQHDLSRRAGQEVVWRPHFAYSTALVILLALIVISMPLWIVLYRVMGTPDTKVGDVIALCMMLLGGFLTAAAAWVIIIEMRGRVRMVDTLARSGEREAMGVAPAAPELPMLDAPLDQLTVRPIGARGTGTAAWEPGNPPPPLTSRVEAHQVSAAATLEASSKLLASFSSVLKSFGQLPAQVAMLTVALGLFVGATILSLH